MQKASSKAMQGKISQDRRYGSRVVVRMDCRIEYGNEIHDASIVNLSPKGAFISAPILPSNNSKIGIEIQSRHLKKDLSLKGKVVRGSEAMTDYGMRGRFAVCFDDTPLDLFVLIGKLHTS
jgi:hypothetical protein